MVCLESFGEAYPPLSINPRPRCADQFKSRGPLSLAHIFAGDVAGNTQDIKIEPQYSNPSRLDYATTDTHVPPA